MGGPHDADVQPERSIAVPPGWQLSRWTTLSGVFVLVSLASACTGFLGAPREEEGERESDTSQGLGDDGQPPGPLSDGVGASDLRRLDRLEFRNSVLALLPDLGDFDAGEHLPDDNHVELAFSLPGTVSELEVKRFADAAEDALAVLGDTTPGVLSGCADDSCASAWIETFAERAFRRPVLSGELEDLGTLYSKLRTDPEMAFSVPEALNGVVEALLQSPGFLYRWERGPQPPLMEGNLVKYDAYEIAARLSYFLWNLPPDEVLLDAAASGQLSAPSDIETQTRRMLADNRFDSALRDFVTQWLELDELPTIIKDPQVYPGFTVGLGSAMLEEAQNFMVHVFRSEEPSLRHLLNANTTFVTPELGGYYGVSVDGDGQADLSPTPRRGILMLGGPQAAKGNSYRTSPVRRGKLILNRFLCDNVPPPPPDVMLDLPPPDPNLTLREQMEIHASSPACANCHSVLDPLGLAFEHFDGAGAYRETEGTLPIDASGTFALKNTVWNFQDAVELVAHLSQSQAVHDCFAKQWLRYALDRFEQDEEEQTVFDVATAHSEADLDLEELIVAITTSKPFSYRALREGEATNP